MPRRTGHAAVTSRPGSSGDASAQGMVARVGRRCARSCGTTRRPGPGCSRGCSSAAPGWCGSTPCARSCCSCRCSPWGRRSGRGGCGRCSSGSRLSLLVSAVAAVGLSWQYLASIAGEPRAAARARRARRWWLVGGARCCGGAAGGCRRSWARWLPDVAAAGLVVLVGPVPREPAAVAGRAPGPERPGVALRRRDAGAPGAAGRRRPHLRRADRGLARPGTSGRSRWSSPSRCWPCSCGARVLSAARAAGRRLAAGAARRRRARRCSPCCGPASRPTTRGPTGGCSSRCRWSWRSSSIGLDVGRAAGRWPPDRAWVGAWWSRVSSAALVVVPAVVATWPHRAGGVERGSLAAVESVLRRAGARRRRAGRRLPGGQRVAAGGARDVRRAGAVDDVRAARDDPRRWPPTVATVSRGGRGARRPARAAGRRLGAGARRGSACRGDAGRRRRRSARTSTCSSGGRCAPTPCRCGSGWRRCRRAERRHPVTGLSRAAPARRRSAGDGRAHPVDHRLLAGADLLPAEAQEAAVLGGVGRCLCRP